MTSQGARRVNAKKKCNRRRGGVGLISDRSGVRTSAPSRHRTNARVDTKSCGLVVQKLGADYWGVRVGKL